MQKLNRKRDKTCGKQPAIARQEARPGPVQVESQSIQSNPTRPNPSYANPI